MASQRPLDRFKKLLPVLFLILVALVIAVVYRNLGRWLATPDRFAAVDVVVVPAGNPDVRVPRALDLLERKDIGATRVWVVTSGAGEVLREPSAIEEYARERGRGEELDVLGRRSRSLVRDARLIAVRLSNTERRDKVDLKLAVITEPVELARTRLVFSRETGQDVLVWRDRSEPRIRGWSGMISEASKVLATMAVLGPGNELLPGPVPPDLPLRAVGGGFLVALIAGAVCRPLARRLRLVSVPRLWRAHATPTPMLGGLALILGLGGGIVAAGGVRLGALGAAAAAGVVVVAIVGLIDDIAGLGARVRLLWAGGAGAVAWLLGLRAAVLQPGDAGADLVNAVVTILWFVGITHALNIFDNIDGAVGGVAAVSAASIAVAATIGRQFVVAVVAAALTGACLGYLFHNVPPARLFMGDMGALALGFSLAALALALTPEPAAPLSMAVPVLALGIPIFDTVVVTTSRIRAGRSPAVGGTDHVAHRLMARGLTVRQAAAFLWASQMLLGAAAVVIARSSAVVGFVVVAVVAAAGGAALLVFLRMRPWMPPWQLEASQNVVDAVEEAMTALRSLEEAVGEEAWRLSNPRAARSTQETLRRLERVRSLLDKPPAPLDKPPAPLDKPPAPLGRPPGPDPVTDDQS